MTESSNVGKRLSGKVALVTGASRGIGRATAAALAAEGALVAAHYGQSEAAVADLVQSVKSEGGQAFAVGSDLESPGGVQRLFDALDAQLLALTGSNQFDILVNNAGIAASTLLGKTDEATFDRLFTVNVKSLFFVTQEAVSRLRDGGRIVNVSSAGSRFYFPGYPVYAATKGAVDTLTIYLAGELGLQGVTVNSVAPGLIATDMTSELLGSSEAEAAALGMQAIPRLGQPEDVARVIAFLASTDGAWVTGQVVQVGGGTRL
ncbi:SDR family oxidoreductase [Leptolyngbya sp. FACHB-261]|uniref:SDR family oxidoreductase n=1 Tax=Leptolyngbya sp. FACHB-261 TaxID=2692806 RepID=UPI0016875C04|nr:SDR family oxidoreductase [Leptolyngbya sp. FACHB-261]MBD2100025.1 SDR family oxidoreductase [Leptolyngbya sp. FACHB-261]